MVDEDKNPENKSGPDSGKNENAYNEENIDQTVEIVQFKNEKFPVETDEKQKSGQKRNNRKDRSDIPALSEIDILKRELSRCKLLNIISLCVAIPSLVLSIFLGIKLLVVRNTVATAIDGVVGYMETLSSKGFDIPFTDTIPVDAEIPINQDITFPFKADIPIETITKVTINLGVLGTKDVLIPIKASVPLDMQIPIKVNQKFRIKTDVPLKMAIPVRFGPNDVLKKWIDQVKDWLKNVRGTI